MNAYKLKKMVEQSGNEPHFFTRDTMRFFGDTMRNFGVRGPYEIVSNTNETRVVYELYRRNPVKHGLKNSFYFDAKTFSRVFKMEVGNEG